MANLDYSLEALNVKAAFYRAEVMVFVEGDDDVLFWHEIMARTTNVKVQIEPVGGAVEIDKRIEQVESGQLKALVARDADLGPIVGAATSTPRVMFTFGYSIENTLYTLEAIHALAKAWSKSPAVGRDECGAWIAELAKVFAVLVHMDVANRIAGMGVTTVGDNCTRFMTSDASAKPCSTRVASHVATTAKLLPRRSMEAARAAVGIATDQVVRFIRGHFLASAVRKFVVWKAKSLGKKVSISAESLYAASLAQFCNLYGPQHPHFIHYDASVTAAIKSL